MYALRQLSTWGESRADKILGRPKHKMLMADKGVMSWGLGVSALPTFFPLLLGGMQACLGIGSVGSKCGNGLLYGVCSSSKAGGCWSWCACRTRSLVTERVCHLGDICNVVALCVCASCFEELTLITMLDMLGNGGKEWMRLCMYITHDHQAPWLDSPTTVSIYLLLYHGLGPCICHYCLLLTLYFACCTLELVALRLTSQLCIVHLHQHISCLSILSIFL